MNSRDNQVNESVKNPAEMRVLFPSIHSSENWDPRQSTSLWKYFVMSNIAGSLIRLGHDTEYIPAFATAWSFSKDKKTLRLKLRDDLKFQDGTIVTTRDIVESLRWALSVKGNSHSGRLEMDERLGPMGVSVSDGLVNITFAEVTNGFLANIGTPEFPIVPEKVRQSEKILLSDIYNMSGPYKVTDHSDQYISLESSLNHPLIEKDSVSKVRIEEVTKFSDALEIAKSDKNTIVVASDYNSGLQVTNSGLDFVASAHALTEMLVPNMQSNKFNEDSLSCFARHIAEFRKSVQLDPYVGEPTFQLFAPGSPARLDNAPLFEKVGTCEDALKGITMELIVLDWMWESPVPEMLQTFLKSRNLELSINRVTIEEERKRLATGNFDLMYIYSGVSATDPIIELNYLVGHPYFESVNTPELKKLIEEAGREADQMEYHDLLRSIHRKILAENRLIPLMHTRMLYATGGTFFPKEINHFDGGLDLWEWTARER